MTQKASDGFTLGAGNLSLPDLAQPNLTTTVPVTVQSNSIVKGAFTIVQIGDGGGLCVAPYLVTDFKNAGTTGSKVWLVSGTHGQSDAEYVYVKDQGDAIPDNHASQAYTVFVKKDGSGIAYSRESAHASDDPHGQTMYLSTSSGRLLEIPYVGGAHTSADYVNLLSDHAAAGNTNTVVGIGDGGLGVTMTFQTSSKACLVNVIS
tara:strand:- start:5663 stop:6277 length:615 start_codon:yes stop_codon:yes gene_type:complete